MPTPVTLEVKLDSKQAQAGTAEMKKQVVSAFDAMRERVAKLNAQMRELVFDPAGILRGADQAAHGLQAVESASRVAGREMQSLKGETVQSGEALGALGKEAAGTGRTLTRLAGTGAATGTALADIATGADAADAALLSLDAGSAAAGKSVAGMGRAAAAALPKLDALSGAAFDPAGVVAGADAATSALGRVKLAAAEVKASLRGASAGSPIFLGGGRRGSQLAEEGAGATTFGGGLRAGAGAAGDLASGGAALMTVLAAVTGKLSAGFDNMLQGVKGNTTMTDADGQRMRQTTLGLMRTGTKDEEIAKAYGHVENMNYTGKDADAIVTQANKMGIATHTNVEDTGQVLARLLREYNQPASRVKAVAETAHLTSAGGDMYLKEFDQYAGKAFATGANSKVSMPEVAAMLRAMTQHGLDIAKASTQAVGLITQMRNPTPQAAKYAQSIGLGGYLGAKALEKYQPSGILAAVAEKTGGDAQKIGSIFKARQGGLGAGILTGMGKGSYDDALNNARTGTKAAFAGKTNAIDPLFNAQMKQTQQQFAALGGEIKSDFIPIGERLGPVFAAAIPLIRTTANVVKTLLDGFTRIPKPVEEAVLGLGALKLIASFLPMLGGFALVSERTTAVLGGLGKMLFGLGGAAAEGEAGLAGTAAVMSGPFALGVLAAVAAVAALALAWKTDFGGIRETTAKVAGEVRAFITSQFGYVVKWFQTNLPLIREVVKTVLTTMQEFWHSHGQRIMAILNPLWSFVKTLFSSALHIILAVVKLSMDVMTGHWGAAAKDIGVIVTNLWAVVRSLFENGAKAIGNTLMLVIDLVLDFGKRLFEGMLNAGQQAINGIVNGIKGGISSVVSAAKGMAASIPTTVKTHLDMHSPSRVMQKLGLNTAEGLAQGIRDGRVSVEQASRMLANTPAAIVRNAMADARRGQAASRKRAGEVNSAGEFAATVGETPEEKQLHKLGEDRARELLTAQQYHAAYVRILAEGNKKTEGEARRHAVVLQQIQDGLKAFTNNPDTPSLDKQEAAAHDVYHRQVKDLGGDTYGPHTKAVETGMRDAGTLLGDKLSGIQAQRDAKQKAEDTAAAEEADAAQKEAQQTTVQLNRELWQHAGGDMKAYFQSLRDEAKDTLKGVQDKFGPASAHPNAPAVDAATAQNAAQLQLIAQQETDAENSLADARQQHDLDQGKISLAQYADYLTKRRDAYAQYSEEWLDLDSKIYSADEEMQRKQLQSIEDLFQAHKISLDNYKKMLSDLAAQVPVASSVHQDVVTAQNGAENKANRGEMVGGQDFWDGLAGSAADNGSKILTALLHPKDKKSIFKSMWTDLMGSLEGGLTGGLSKILKNMLTGQSGGLNLGGLFGGLFGGKSNSSQNNSSQSSAASGVAAGGSAGMGAMMSMIPGLGGIGSMLPSLLGSADSLSPQGINGPVGGLQGITGLLTGGPGQGGPLGGLTSLLPMLAGKGGMLGGLLGHGGMAGLLGHGMMSALPWVGGGILLNKLLGNPIGKLFKHFHFAQGGIVPGTGNHDSVHAMLTPEEMVLPKAISKRLMQQAAMPDARSAAWPRMPGGIAGIEPSGTTTTGRGQTSGSHAEINYFGDNHYHYEEDTARSHRKLAKTLEDLVRGGTPA